MKNFKSSTFAGIFGLAACAAVASFVPLAAAHAKTVMVGGAAMYPSRNIIQNAVNSKDHTTLVAAVKAAGLVDTLEGPGPFTVFAPTNEAFAKLPAGTVAALLKPENKPKLTAILTYHVVAGKYSTGDLMRAVRMGGGEAMLKTVEGEPLTVKDVHHRLEIIDAKGRKAWITIANVAQSNGMIQVINKVLLPN
ncbi:fasciclin domain-containing protein [Methylovirgula sp. HY1]|uniref:fasciclin domain-containing protein n=1 Tax=Methylovirgula sp. HY1 TaxID=2822761 RepID=UPI001C5AD729|nr:fasciclin domain-containing protein [Methylovirgula sp. HY1]QXX76175.1 Immunogenic protein MPB70 [Methylovirgula sp. HY1]